MAWDLSCSQSTSVFNSEEAKLWIKIQDDSFQVVSQADPILRVTWMNTLAELSVIDNLHRLPLTLTKPRHSWPALTQGVLRCFVQEGPCDANKGFGMVKKEKRRTATSPAVEWKIFKCTLSGTSCRINGRIKMMRLVKTATELTIKRDLLECVLKFRWP